MGNGVRVDFVGAGPRACPDVDPCAADINKNDLKMATAGGCPYNLLRQLIL